MFGDDGYVDEYVGMDMVDNGMMNVEQGMILTDMGYPGLGMADMAYGEMQIAQGTNLMQVGMMQNNMGMGYGMGYGMGVDYGMGYGVGMGVGLGVGTGVGLGVLAAEQALLFNQPYVCMGLGCTYPCCVRRCAPGCQLACCRNKVVIVQKNYPVQNNNMAYNTQQYNKPVVYNQPVAYNQPNYTNNQANLVNRQVNYVNQPQVYQNQGYQNVPQQQIQTVSQTIPVQNQAQVIYSGSLYNQSNFTWHFNQTAVLTSSHFVNEPFSSIIKVKIKRQVAHNDCLFLKTSHFGLDHYYAVPRHEQANWFCSIVWAKMQLSRHNCDLHAQFNGQIEGKLARKSLFLGEWAFRDVVIDSQGLKSYKNRNQMPTTRMARIPQIWTRFQLIQNGMFLVIKLHHEGSKYEYGIPLQNAILWIRAFCSLMR